MTKDEIVQKVQDLGLPKGSYVVFGSCPMAVAGIRESDDIDMLVKPAVAKALQAAGWERDAKSTVVSDVHLAQGIFDIHTAWVFDTYSPTLAELLNRADMIDGVPIASLADVRAWKQAFGRPKDLRDVQLIDVYLAQRKLA